MGLKRDNLLVGVVVKDAQLKIVGTCYEPVLASDKFYAADGNFSDLECFDDCACIMIVDVDRSIIETSQEPWLGWMEIDAFDTI